MYRRHPVPPPQKQRLHRINEMIQAREIRVIDDDKSQLGIMTVPDALALARGRGLDLVEIAAQANPPVCRIMDYGKFLYELHKRDHEAKRHQKQVQIKEIKYRPKISVHDYDFKTKHVRAFLEEGHKVKLTVMLRGREKSKPELGHAILDRVIKDVQGLGKQDGGPKKMDWCVSALLVPTKTPGERDAKAKDTPGSQEAV